MDFAKFVSLIDRQALFFTRVQHLRYCDSFEGSYSKITLDHALPPAPNRLVADYDRHIVVSKAFASTEKAIGPNFSSAALSWMNHSEWSIPRNHFSASPDSCNANRWGPIISVIGVALHLATRISDTIKEHGTRAIRRKQVKRVPLPLNDAMLLGDRGVLNSPVAVRAATDLERRLVHHAMPPRDAIEQNQSWCGNSHN